MKKIYRHQKVEERIYKMWEGKGYFTPRITPQKKPFCIIMPPPNANAPLHIGHAMFVTIEDILIRYHRMRGESTLWLPGADHAGILTQVVFERKLAREGKTRYDLGRERFYQECFEFTQKNKKIMYSQIKALGASCDWTREKFTLNPQISKVVLETFVRLYKDGLVYRGERIINWCPRCTTALSDLEVVHKEQKDPLYYIKYPLKRGGFLTVATTRPETMFGDTALAVNPKDKRWEKIVGQKAILPIINREIPIITAPSCDPEFGTGVVKVTPAHDPEDFEIGKKNHLEFIRVIDFDLRLNKNVPKAYQGFNIFKARKRLAQDLAEMGLLEKVDKNYLHAVAICERCKTQIEPLVSLQWFIKGKPLAKRAIEAVKNGKIKIIPKRFEKNYFLWMENIKDWCVSRQLWWGHQIPVFYCGTKGLSSLQKKLNPKLLEKYKNKGGCGETIVSSKRPKKCPKCGGKNIIQDPDTFDAWFSSGQWPFTTLGFRWNSTSKVKDKDTSEVSDFDYFYPTSVMETGYEILFFWVARMVMLGLYATGKVPFRVVYLHGLVRDAFGEKMSKSKGNVIDPLDVVKKYGADAVRFSLIWGTAPGTDLHLGEERIRGMRNFSNKIWNIGRFIKIQNSKIKTQNYNLKSKNNRLTGEDQKILSDLGKLIKDVTSSLDNFRFSDAASYIYHFLWHRFADQYIEYAKEEIRNLQLDNLRIKKNKRGVQLKIAILNHVYLTCLKLLHPFMPFITEEIWQRFGQEKPLIISSWPKV